jgi:POT family proton-dependent oligopeptide transporter
VICGTGLLKPNISAIVGELYAPGDPRRDAGFTLFYIGINIGGALGPLVTGWLARESWHYGFAAAGVGMLFGLLQFRLTRDQLGDAGATPAAPPPPGVRRAAWTVIAAVLLGALALLALGAAGAMTFNAPSLLSGTQAVLVGSIVLYFAYVFIGGKLTREERNRMIVVVALVIACAMFWAGFEQAGSSLNLFAERFTDRVIGGFEIPASWFQSLNPAMIIVLAPFYSMLWVALARRFLEPSVPAKFALGLIIMGLGFAVMMGAAVLVASGQQVLPTWLFFTYLLHTMGELALSPVGLSAMTKLAPRRFVGQTMGIWFMANSLGYAIAGRIAGGFDTEALGAWPGQYLQIVLTTVGTGVVLLVLAKPLRKLMGSAG